MYDEGIQTEIRNPNPNTRKMMIVEMRSLPQNSMEASERERRRRRLGFGEGFRERENLE